MSTTQSNFHDLIPARHWLSPAQHRAGLLAQPKAGHPPKGVHVPVRTNWEDRQPAITLDEVFNEVL